MLLWQKISKISSCMFVCTCVLFATTPHASAYDVTYNCGSANGESWDDSNSNPVPYTTGAHCLSNGRTLAGWCCRNGLITNPVLLTFGESVNFPDSGSNAICSALWNYQRSYPLTYFIGNCSISTQSNSLGNTYYKYADDGIVMNSETCDGNTNSQNVAPKSILSPNSINWDSTVSNNNDIDNIFTAGDTDLSNCVNFTGWANPDTGTTYTYTGTTFNPDTVSVTSTTDLYAQCNWTQYSVKYHDCDGNSHTASNTLIYGQKLLMPAYDSATGTDFPSDNYTFGGWNYSGNNYAADDNFTLTDCLSSGSTIDFYAVCTPITYTVTYTCNGTGHGTGTPPTGGTYSPGDSVITPTIQETLAVFEGECENTTLPELSYWECYSANNSYIIVEPGNSFTITSDKVCKPHWSRSTYPIKLLASALSDWGATHIIYSWTLGGAYLNNTYSSSFMTTTSNPLPNADIPSRNGYTFTGYYSQDQENTSLPAGTQYIGSDGYITEYGMEEAKWIRYLSGHPDSWYAGWTPIQYTIDYDLNGGNAWTQNDNHPTTIAYDQDFNVSNPTKTGFVFTGWTITGMDTDTHYYGTNTTSNTTLTGITETSFKNLRSTAGTVTFAAQWECAEGYVFVSETDQCVPAEYTVTYVVTPSGVTNAPSQEQATGGSAHTLATIPSVTGYSCSNWNCKDASNNDVGTRVTVNSHEIVRMPYSNVTCTSNCTVNTIHLIWDTDNGTMDSNANPSSSCVYGSGVGENGGINGIVQPTRFGHTFLGWLLTNIECDLSNIDTNIPGQHENFATGPQWSTTFNYGTFYGISQCSTLDGADLNGYVGQIPDCSNGGECIQCWCKLTGFAATGAEQCSVTSTSWAFARTESTTCQTTCNYTCEYNARADKNFRDKLLLYQSQ